MWIKKKRVQKKTSFNSFFFYPRVYPDLGTLSKCVYAPFSLKFTIFLSLCLLGVPCFCPSDIGFTLPRFLPYPKFIEIQVSRIQGFQKSRKNARFFFLKINLTRLPSKAWYFLSFPPVYPPQSTAATPLVNQYNFHDTINS